MNDETRDQALSRLYREGAWPEPSRQIDQAILAASLTRRSRNRYRGPRWRLYRVSNAPASPPPYASISSSSAGPLPMRA